MGAVVVRWTGLEARALRLARRMSVREFAAHLGVNDAAVASWERRKDKARLRYETQQMLDTDLGQVDADVQQRFELLRQGDQGAVPNSGDDAGDLSQKHGSQQGKAPPVSPGTLGSSSSARTKMLLAALQARTGSESPLLYTPPDAATNRLTDFLLSPLRAYVIKGRPGCGKTLLTRHLAAEFAGRADFQLHAVDTSDTTQLDLATDILRYASIPAGDDAQLTLEQHVTGTSRLCLVVVDGINTRQQLDEIGRQVDGILRQVIADTLRFLLVVRTPPDVEMTAYPVLAASVYHPPGRPQDASYGLSPWDATEARDVWNLSRREGEPTFSDLPLPIQRLARLPLYMRLLKMADHRMASGELNAYRLVDQCVKSQLRASHPDVERVTDALAGLARAQAPGLFPSQLSSQPPHRPPVQPESPLWNPIPSPLVRTSPDGHLTFDHDVFREYFLATHIAALLIERGRSVATVAALNNLAAQASMSAIAHGVFEFVVCCLDTSAPDLLAAVALSPTVSVETTLPLMLKFVGDRAGFATGDVLRTCASRCLQDSALELARALLGTPATAKALEGEHGSWLIGLLRRFGSSVWTHLMICVEETLDARATTHFLASADLNNAEEATFFARYFFIFFGNEHAAASPLEDLLAHPDWRVRAALAEGLHDEHSPPGTFAEFITERLARDPDYKVRAAVARAVARADLPLAERHLATLLLDDNWHVRENLLRGIATGEVNSPSTDILAEHAIRVITAEQSWWPCPAHVDRLVARILLLHESPDRGTGSRARQHALFALLRELRTGWIRLPDKTRQALVAEAAGSPHWLVRRETEPLPINGKRDERHAFPAAANASPKEQFRRLRDRRSVQVALDLYDLEHAVAVATAAASAGVDLIEVGDPLIKQAGIGAIEHIKSHVPDITVVAEMMSADWGRDQVVLAAEAGADAVLLIGPATAASVSAAVRAGQRLDVPVLLDTSAGHATQTWVRDMERAGVDGFAVTTNIDLGIGVAHPLTTAAAIRGWTRLPIAVSGGFTATDHRIIDSSDWDVLIVGRAVTEAVNPAVAARQLVELIHRHRTREPR